jgi:hypothetical protein
MVDRAFVPPNTENSPIVYARVAGALYLVIIILGLSSELLVRSGLIVWGDAAATAASISASPGVFRLGFVADSVMVICDVALAVLLFALLLLEGTGFAAAFDPAQLQSLSYLFLDLHAHGYDIGLLLFGVHCLLLGYLIIRARYFPKAIGIMIAAGGLVYLLGSYARFLAPGYGSALVPLYAVPLVAELSLCLWLLFRGVDLEQWRAVAAGS